MKDTSLFRVTIPVHEQATREVKLARLTRIKGAQIRDSSYCRFSVNSDGDLLVTVCASIPLIFIKSHDIVAFNVKSPTGA